MLNIYFGDLPEAIYNTSVYFDNTYQDRWIIKPLSMEMIEAVDKSRVVDAQTIYSPIFGNMSPRQLSGGVKTLLLVANNRNKIFNASTCGDNCAQWLLKMAKDRKVVVNLHHLMDFGDEPFKIRVLNTGKIVKGMTELVMEAGEFV